LGDGGEGRLLLRLPIKSPQLVSVFIEASSSFLNKKDVKKFKTFGAYTLI